MDGAAEPWFAPVWRFARTVMLIDLLLGVVIAVLSIWRGWTSVGDSSTALLLGGGVLAGIGVLPVLGPTLGPALLSILGLFASHGYQPMVGPYHQGHPASPDGDRSPATIRISALLATAGLLAAGYGLAVKVLFA